MVDSIHFYLSFIHHLLFVVACFETWIHCLYSIGQYCNILLQCIVLFGQWKHIHKKKQTTLIKYVISQRSEESIGDALGLLSIRKLCLT